MSVVGILNDESSSDPMLNFFKIDKDLVPTQSYADIAGLDKQIQEIKVCCVKENKLSWIFDVKTTKGFHYRGLSIVRNL